ncbi:MAG: serpin family protein [Acidimicrobiia bacterium]
MKADLPRITSTDVTDVELSDLVAGNTDFALELYGAVRDELNVFLSPYSAAEALTMTYAGAHGETASEMREILQLGLTDDRVHPGRNELNLRLGDPGPELPPGDWDPFVFRSVNSLWGQHGYDFVPAFLELLALHYDAGMNLVNFAGDPEGARLAINESVSIDTEGRIEDLIPQGLISTLTRLVLVNAVYFKASWLSPFDGGNTFDGQFTTRDSRTVSVPMMKQNARVDYAQGAGYQAVRLRYAGPASMLVILPEDFEGFDLGSELLAEVRGSLLVHDVDLEMPRFSFRSSLAMKEILTGLGMEASFAPPPGLGTADFTGITPPPPELYIQDVVHEAFVAVDEEGTEAAAATGVVMGLTAAFPQAALTLDRPFIFLIQHDGTGELLFVGHVGEPVEEG